MRETWTNRFGFIMATAGFAIGLGNIWRFSYTTGMNGGGAFLLMYVGFAVLIGIPLMSAELSLGRRAQLTPIAGMQRLTGSKWSPWNLVAWLGCAGAVMIQAYYLMLIGWIIGYLVMILSGSLAGASAESLEATYEAFTGNPGPVLGYTLLVVLALGVIASRGLRAGLERLSSTAMPVLFVLLILLAVRSLTLPGAMRGLAWYLTPDFSAIDSSAALAALGQSFYSIGIGMAAAFGFGSYLSRDGSDVPGSAAIVVACDTLVAFIAGLVIFPALFAFGIEPDAGPGLVFMTMPNLFNHMPGGQMFGALFFSLLILAAITSSAALHEVLTTTLTDLVTLRRRTANWLLVGVFGLLSSAVILSQQSTSSLRVWGMNLFDFLDSASTNFVLPATALVLSLYVVFAWGFERFREDTNVGAGRLRVSAGWKPLMLVLIPVAVAMLLLMGLGIV